MTEAWAIEAHDLVKTFGTNRAVDGVDLLVETGSVYGVLGPNGAGKTTTIRMLATLLRADRCPQPASAPSPPTNPTFRPPMSVVAA
jgi:ABC-type Na+ transport system ATPase subunit NatA